MTPVAVAAGGGTTTVPVLDPITSQIASAFTGPYLWPHLFDYANLTLKGYGDDGIAPPIVKVKSSATPGRYQTGNGEADNVARSKGVDPFKKGGSVVDLAATQIGSPYVWDVVNPIGPAGGPGSGFDCSGLAMWAYGHFGVSLPHQSTQQAAQLTKIAQVKDLQAGDLVFFSYGRLGAGVVDHVGIYAGNGQMIAASPSGGGVTRQSVDWAHFVQGGRAAKLGSTAASVPSGKAGAGKGAKAPTTPKVKEPIIPDMFSAGNTSLGMSHAVIESLLQPQSQSQPGQTPGRGGVTNPDVGGSVKAQLYQGFVDGGRPDLARMVKTKAFDTWVKAESGWTVDSVSQYFPDHGRNYGLFQFWQGYDWTKEYLQGGDWIATAYEQARLVCRHFPSLTPAEIRHFAAEIASGSYHGW